MKRLAYFCMVKSSNMAYMNTRKRYGLLLLTRAMISLWSSMVLAARILGGQKETLHSILAFSSSTCSHSLSSRQVESWFAR
jgi:hypothetical protein